MNRAEVSNSLALPNRNLLVGRWNAAAVLPEDQLAQRIVQVQQTNDPVTRNDIQREIIESNLGLIISAIKWYTKIQPSPDNYFFQAAVIEGALALLVAVSKFEVQKDSSFFNFALPWIRSAVTRLEMNEATLIHVPIHVQIDIRRLTFYEEKIKQISEHNSESSYFMELLIDAYQKNGVSISYDKILQLRKYRQLQNCVSTDEVSSAQGFIDNWLEVFPSPLSTEEEAIERADFEQWHNIFCELLDGLSEFEKQIVYMRLTSPVECVDARTKRRRKTDNDTTPFREIGERFGRTGENIGKIYAAALVKIQGNAVKLELDKKEILLQWLTR